MKRNFCMLQSNINTLKKDKNGIKIIIHLAAGKFITIIENSGHVIRMQINHLKDIQIVRIVIIMDMLYTMMSKLYQKQLVQVKL